MHESQMHALNSYVTLTYDDDHLPADRSLSMRDLQLFMKRLRKVKGNGVRYYACGEYGDGTNRPHYHLLLFNCQFADRKPETRNKNGDTLYSSEELRKLWPNGHNWLGEVTEQSAMYVASYIFKKQTGERAKVWYEWTDPDGEVHIMQPEFTLMSRRPGIGYTWYEKYGAHAYAREGTVIFRGQEIKAPPYYDKLYEKIEAAKLAAIKKLRRRSASQHRADNTPERRRVREQVAHLNLNRKKREAK